MGLREVRADEGGEQRCACAAADVAGEIGEAGDLIALLRGDTDVVECADGDEDEWQGHHLENAPDSSRAECCVQVEPRKVVDADGGAEIASATWRGSTLLARRLRRDDHHDHEHESGGREHHTGSFGGVAEQGLQILRDKDRRAKEHHAEDELEKDGCAEIVVVA